MMLISPLLNTQTQGDLPFLVSVDSLPVVVVVVVVVVIGVGGGGDDDGDVAAPSRTSVVCFYLYLTLFRSVHFVAVAAVAILLSLGQLSAHIIFRSCTVYGISSCEEVI